MKRNLKFLLPLLALTLIACTSDSEDDLMEMEEPGGPVTYNSNIRAIIGSNCLNCHSDPTRNGAPFSLTNFQQVSTRAENGSLSRAINKQTGDSGAMPPGGRLPQTTIDLIDQWIDEGFLEQ
ncbi:hypothetical protein [Ulvibacterium sp.]|uniref:hypothetical protein n=1 Tax=Ulvibacterium sp. TaxID=2665914 RepID=UPI003CC5E785